MHTLSLSAPLPVSAETAGALIAALTYVRRAGPQTDAVARNDANHTWPYERKMQEEAEVPRRQTLPGGRADTE